jgi:cytidylate kinase
MEFVQTHFGIDPNEVHQYDLVLNSSLLGVEASTQVIVVATRHKEALLQQEEEPAAEL